VNKKKFFSLLHGQEITTAPDAKVIPESDYSSLLDAKKLIEEAKKDAEKYREEVEQECIQLKEQAKKEGFEKGFSDWTAAIATLEAEVVNVKKEMEKTVVPIALKAARKILGRELETSESAVVDIVATSLKGVAQHKKVTIWVNPKELDTIQGQKKKLQGIFENLEVLSVRPRNDVKEGGCVIETEAGIINAQLENQWMILENAFQKLMEKSSKT
jgi:type III secretion protein L